MLSVVQKQETIQCIIRNQQQYSSACLNAVGVLSIDQLCIQREMFVNALVEFDCFSNFAMIPLKKCQKKKVNHKKKKYNGADRMQ